MAAAGTAQRPEQFLVTALVAFDDATVRQDDLRPEQVVAGQAVLPAEDPQPTPEGEAGDPDRGTAAGRDSQGMLGERIAEVAEPHAGTDGRHVACDHNQQMGVTFRTTPSVEDRPATECPPLRIAVGKRSPRTPARVAAMSAGVAHCTTAIDVAGGRSGRVQGAAGPGVPGVVMAAAVVLAAIASVNLCAVRQQIHRCLGRVVG
jgi:hypothetical protein